MSPIKNKKSRYSSHISLHDLPKDGGAYCQRGPTRLNLSFEYY